MGVFGSTNLRLGDLDLAGFDEVTGVEFGCSVPDGWAGRPKPTLQATQRPQAPGAYLSSNYSGTRHLALKGWIRTEDASLMTAGIDRLNEAAALAATRLTVTELDLERFVDVQLEDELITNRSTRYYAEWSAQFLCVRDGTGEWRKFGDELSATTSLPSTTGGFIAPFSSPFSSNAVVQTGQVGLVNPGNEKGPVTLRIDGPVQGPVVTHVASGLSLVFSTSLTLNAGEWLEVDMERKTVRANGQAGRSGWVIERGWSGFDKGPNVWAFTAAVFNADARLTVNATPAWL